MDKTLKEIALLFLKLGTIGFGGPAVHIAMMQKEVVEKKKWMTAERFLDLVGATNLIPGPNSTEMTMHCGHERGGWRGLVIAGVCFILPAVIITSILGWAYKEYGSLPEVAPFLYGIKPAVIAVVVSAMIALGKKALTTSWLWTLGICCFIVSLAGGSEILVLFGAGIIGIFYHVAGGAKTIHTIVPLAVLPVSNIKLFWTFLKIGSLLYGSGYVLFAFLDTELVSRGFLTKTQMVDAIAVGQFTPGPVFSAATFIGWQINGVTGGILVTIGIFLPSFLFVALLKPLVARLRNSKVMSAFLDAVNVASIAIILEVCVDMCKASVQDWETALIGILGLAITLAFKNLNTAFIVAGGAILGYLLGLI